MDENIFSGEQLDELDEQGFTGADIEFLETLGRDVDDLYDAIMKEIVDGQTYEEIMVEIRRQNPHHNPVPVPVPVHNHIINPVPLPNRNLPRVPFSSNLGLSNLFGGKRNKSKKNKSKRNKSKRNKSKRNKSKRNKSKRKK